MPRERKNPSNTMNNQGKRANKKKNLKSPEKLKDIEVCDLNYREFKTGVPKNSKSYKKKPVLVGVAQWTECQPVN